MTPVSETKAPRSAPSREVEFALDRFTSEEGRLIVEGRWYGILGRRFMRPVLQVEGRRRLMAVLDHKPWPAADGSPWIAAFPHEGEAGPSRLQVAPDVAVELPAPRPRAGDGERRPARVVSPRLPDGRQREMPVEPPPEPERPASHARPSEAGPAPDPVAPPPQVIGEPPAPADTTPPTLEEPVGSLELRSERDAALADAQRAREERDAATAEIEHLRNELEAARAEAERLRDERERAVTDAERLRDDRAKVAGDVVRASDEREQAIAERDRMEGERDRAVAEVDRVRAEHEHTKEALQHVQADVQRLQTAAARALGERNAANDELERLRRETSRQTYVPPRIVASEPRSQRHWAVRTLAVVLTGFCLFVLASLLVALL